MRSFVSWWLAQLGALVPDIVVHALHRPADAVILGVGPGTVSLSIRSQGKVTAVAHAHATDVGMRELAEAIKTYSPRPHLLVLRLPPDRLLRKHLMLPIAARRDLKQLLGFEIERETPFTQDEVYWNYVVREGTA